MGPFAPDDTSDDSSPGISMKCQKRGRHRRGCLLSPPHQTHTDTAAFTPPLKLPQELTGGVPFKPVINTTTFGSASPSPTLRLLSTSRRSTKHRQRCIVSPSDSSSDDAASHPGRTPDLSTTTSNTIVLVTSTPQPTGLQPYSDSSPDLTATQRRRQPRRPAYQLVSDSDPDTSPTPSTSVPAPPTRQQLPDPCTSSSSHPPAQHPAPGHHQQHQHPHRRHHQQLPAWAWSSSTAEGTAHSTGPWPGPSSTSAHPGQPHVQDTAATEQTPSPRSASPAVVDLTASPSSGGVRSDAAAGVASLLERLTLQVEAPQQQQQQGRSRQLPPAPPAGTASTPRTSSKPPAPPAETTSTPRTSSKPPAPVAGTTSTPRTSSKPPATAAGTTGTPRTSSKPPPPPAAKLPGNQATPSSCPPTNRMGANEKGSHKTPGSRAFMRNREAIARQMYSHWNLAVFGDQLPHDLPISWNPRLKFTAGQCIDDGTKNHLKTKRNQKIPTRIELSSKVIDNLERLRQTLAHEMCHVAAWGVEHDYAQPHGRGFTRWARLFMATEQGLSITRCHNYTTFMPFRWQCVTEGCGTVYSRCSKSIDVSAHACSRCHGRLRFLGKFDREGNLVPERGPTEYSLFVQQHFSEVKATLPPGTPGSVVMKAMSARWKAAKSLQKAATPAGGAEGGTPGVRRVAGEAAEARRQLFLEADGGAED